MSELSVPALGTVMVAEYTVSKATRGSTPACSPLPCAMTVEHVPSGFGTTSVNGIVLSSTPVLLLQFCKDVGGLKATMGKFCLKSGVVEELTSNVPLLFG